jgi:hypothetical protein
MDRLDSAVGPENWQTRFHDVAGKSCCEIGVRIGDDWVWKSDGAGETSIEGEKGSFSDAFKRAAVHWGIARDLYPDAQKNEKEEIDVLSAREKAEVLFDKLSKADQMAFLELSNNVPVVDIAPERLPKALAWMTARIAG